MIISSVNQDDYYINHLKAMLSSLRKNSPNLLATIYLINCDKRTSDNLKTSFDSYLFENVEIDLSSYSEDQRKAFLASYRTRIFREKLKKEKKVLWLDSDVVVRKDISIMFEDLSENSLKIMYRKDHKDPNCFFQVGVVGFGIGEESSRLIENWDTSTHSKYYWYNEQYNLYQQYALIKNNIKLIELDYLYNDFFFRPESYIWHCKRMRFKNPKFQNEFKRYISYV